VDFLLVLMELICMLPPRRYELAISLQRGQLDPKFQFAPNNHSSSQKTRLNGLSYGKKLDRSFFRFVTHNPRVW